MSVLSALVFSVGILYGQSEQQIRKENKGTTVMVVDPRIYINQIVVHQGEGSYQVLPTPAKAAEAAPEAPMAETPVAEAAKGEELEAPIVEELIAEVLPELENVWNDTVQAGMELSHRTRRSPQLSLKSNLLEDFAYMPQFGFCPFPNVGIEYYLKDSRWSFGASLDIPWWEKEGTHKYFQARNWQIETRRYFFCDPGEFSRMYLQAYANACVFGISLKDNKAWQGEGVGGGLGIGYVWRLTQRLRIESGVQVGILMTQYDPFTYGDPIDHVDNGYFYYDWDGHTDDFKKRQYRYNWIGPTRASLTIIYNLFLRRRQKGDAR